MEVQEITNKEEWEGFLEKCREKTFLHSWNWGEFEQKRNHRIWRFGFFEGSKLLGVVFAVKIAARRGTFLLIPHGPVLAEDSAERKQEVLKVLLGKLSLLGKQEGASFLRMSPLWERTEENEKLVQKLGFRESSMHADYTYEASWKLDLNPSEQELLAKMRKTTRYLIRQTEKNKDIAIEKSSRAEDRERYEALNLEVASRQQFVPFSEEFIKNEVEVFLKDGKALWFFGKYKGEDAAGALVVFWSGIGFYHQAASRKEFSKLSIPYLLQWEAIKEAKKIGCRLYDFWGYVDPKKHSSHPWAGPSLFKQGFGGRERTYLKTQDYALSWKYWLTFFFELLRRIKRGL